MNNSLASASKNMELWLKHVLLVTPDSKVLGRPGILES